jgi:rhodanese-related sulfurtransferase
MRKSRTLLNLLFVAVMPILAACSQAADTVATDAAEVDVADLSQNADGYTDITVQQLASMLPNKDFTLVNVHIPFEGDIPETDVSIPYNEIANHVDQLPDKNAPIVLYCRSGSMSTQAAETLADLGYTNVMELDGGFNAWKSAGHELAGQ